MASTATDLREHAIAVDRESDSQRTLPLEPSVGYSFFALPDYRASNENNG